MPLYEYACENGHRFERIQKFSDPPVATCPTCESPVRKLLSSPAIQFKGSGWYITDYAKKGSSGASDSGASETKSESKSEGSESKAKPAETSTTDKPSSSSTKAD